MPRKAKPIVAVALPDPVPDPPAAPRVAKRSRSPATPSPPLPLVDSPPRPGDPVAMPWGGLTVFTGRPCGDCGKVWRFEVVKTWLCRRWNADGPQGQRPPSIWHSSVEIVCPDCCPMQPWSREWQRRQHLGWYDLHTGRFQMDADPVKLEPPAGIDEGMVRLDDVMRGRADAKS